MQNALLGRGQSEDAAQQLRPHVAHAGADGVAALLIDVPEGGGVAAIGKAAADAEFVDALLHALAADARGADTGHVALDVAQKHGHPRVGEGLGHHLHGDGLAGAAGAGDQTVPVAHVQCQLHRLVICQTHIDPAVLVHIAVLRYLLLLFPAIIRRPPPRRKGKCPFCPHLPMRRAPGKKFSPHAAMPCGAERPRPPNHLAARQLKGSTLTGCSLSYKMLTAR